jgi:hypothetical protein
MSNHFSFSSFQRERGNLHFNDRHSMNNGEKGDLTWAKKKLNA